MRHNTQKLILSMLLVLLSLSAITVTCFAWFYYSDSAVHDFVGLAGEKMKQVSVALYRGYDYDFDGKLEIKESVSIPEGANYHEVELSEYYNEITNSESLSSIMAGYRLSYRLIIHNNENQTISLENYYKYDSQTKNESILFGIGNYQIHQFTPSTWEQEGDGELLLSDTSFKNMSEYMGQERFIKNITISPNSIVVIDFQIAVLNSNDVIPYFNQYYYQQVLYYLQKEEIVLTSQQEADLHQMEEVQEKTTVFQSMTDYLVTNDVLDDTSELYLQMTNYTSELNQSYSNLASVVATLSKEIGETDVAFEIQHLYCEFEYQK